MQLNQLLISSHWKYTSNKQWKKTSHWWEGVQWQIASVKAEARGDWKPHLEKTRSLLLCSVYLTLLPLGIKHWDHFNSWNFHMDPIAVPVMPKLNHLLFYPRFMYAFLFPSVYKRCWDCGIRFYWSISSLQAGIILLHLKLDHTGKKE